MAETTMDRGSESNEGTVEQHEVSNGAEEEVRGQTEETSDDTSEVGGEDEKLKYEDAIETARRYIEESRKAEKQDSEELDTNQEEDSTSKPSPPEQLEPDDIEPPTRLSNEQKQRFKKLSKSAKGFVSDTINQMESKFTQSMQQTARIYNEAKHIIDEVRPYYQANPEFAKNNISEAGIVRTLLGNHRALTSDDYNTRRQTWLDIGKSIGMKEVDNLAAQGPKLTQEGQIDSQAIQTLINNTLQEKLNPVTSYIESQKEAQQDVRVNAIVSEVKKVMTERDSLGNFVYPELQDGNYIVQQVKPLVDGLTRSRPDLSYPDAFKVAVTSLRAINGQSIPSNPARLPSNNQSQNTRAAEAGVSVRGKSAGNVQAEKLSPLQQRIMDMFPVGGS